MNIFQEIKSFFSSKPSEQNPDAQIFVPTQSIEIVQSQQEVFEPLVQNLTVATVAESLPEWLKNEDFLRDEGTLFGLSEAKSEEKTAIIKHYFAQQTAGIEQEIEQYNEQIGELNQWIVQKEETVSQLENKVQILKNQEFTDEHHLFRTIAGLLISIGMGIGNFFLIDESLASAYTQSTWVAMGVFLAGMFNLFGRTSFLHENQDTGQQALWKRILEEFGMPLAASFFVFVHVAATKPSLIAFSLWAFTFFLFLFVGKLLLGNLTMLQRDLTIFGKQRTLASDKVHKVQEWESEMDKLKAQVADFRSQKHEILPLLTSLSTSLARKNAQRDVMIKLFESEFNLARNLKNHLTSQQVKKIMGQ